MVGIWFLGCLNYIIMHSQNINNSNHFNIWDFLTHFVLKLLLKPLIWSVIGLIMISIYLYYLLMQKNDVFPFQPALFGVTTNVPHTQTYKIPMLSNKRDKKITMEKK